MLCRVADSLFWMGRYMERAENTARLVDVYLQIALELDREDVPQHWEPILSSTGDLELFKKLYKKTDHFTVPDFLTFNADNPSSIFGCIVAARENARQIRDQISTEMWEVINRLYLKLRSSDIREVWNREPYSFYREIKEHSHLFHGLTEATFPHQEGLHFIKCGMYVERAEKTGRILDIKYHLLLPSVREVGGGRDVAQWVSLLKACSAVEAYQQLYVSEVNPHNVAEFLVLSPNFPRSVMFCIESLRAHLHAISKCPVTHYSNEAERLCGKLLASMKFSRTEELLAYGLHETLTDIHEELGQISMHINEAYMFFPIVDPAAEATGADESGVEA